MPTHRVRRAFLYEDLRSLEREHEHAIDVRSDPDDPEFMVVTTVPCNEIERRRLSVAETVREQRYAGGVS